MTAQFAILAVALPVFLVACGSLEKKAILLNLGDSKDKSSLQWDRQTTAN